MILTFSVVCLWTLISPILLGYFFKKNETLTGSLRSSLETLLQYQIKHEALFERIYIQKQDLLTSKTSFYPETSTRRKNLLETKYFNIQGETLDCFISIENPSILVRKNDFELSLALRNRKNTSKADGSLLIKTEWQDAKGNILNLFIEKKHTFSIRHYKLAKFSFEIPSDHPILSKLEVWIQDKRNHQSKFELVDN
jgi:hypothetical protein